MENIKEFLNKNTIKIGYVIETTSGWYWSGFQDKKKPVPPTGYTIFETEEEAISFLPAAMDFNTEPRSIKKVYYNV